ncbi:hypothetical protein OPV22_021216 [Ensete ventricosum]|uniref:Uncharacterized protein n=1 Tax=Ensete ventricosum TaxID=4639 RepID=A0AAV8QRH2_ENSVE|nr:hypothetical protein OPV22_021216 [Ensete ventricosum]
MSGNDRSGLRLASGEMNQILNSVGNSSGPSVGASSLVTDANSGLSGGPQLQKSTSFNNESYMGLPASPISFSSNFSGSSVMDGCSIVQQSSLQEQVQKQGLSTATSQLVQQEPNNLINAQKKPRLGVKHEDLLQQQLIQQLLQRHDRIHPQGQQNLQLQTILQQQRLMQRQQHQQQIMQSLSQMQQGPITLQQQQQLRHHLQPQSIQSATLVKRPLDNGICSRRLMQYLYHQRHRPPVNQLLQVAQKYQSTVTENNTAGVSHQDLQASCNMFAAIGRQLARNFDLQSLNDLGFSKRYVRCLQISEVVSSMKDLIDFSQEQKIGAIESLKNYPRHAAAKLQKRKLDEEQVISSHNLPGDPSTLKKATGIQAGLNNYISNNPAASQVADSSQQGGQALNSFQNMLRNTLNLKQNVLPEEALSSLSASKHAQPLQFQGSVSSVSIDASVSNLSGQHRQQPPLDVRLQQQYNLQNPQVNQHMQQHVIQQMLQEMMNNNKGASQQSVIAPNATAGLAAGDVTGGDVTATPVMVDTGSIRNALELQSMQTNLRNNVTGGMGSRSYSFQSAVAASNPSISGNVVNSRPDLPQNKGLPEMDHIAQEFAENGIFDPDSWLPMYCEAKLALYIYLWYPKMRS